MGPALLPRAWRACASLEALKAPSRGLAGHQMLAFAATPSADGSPPWPTGSTRRVTRRRAGRRRHPASREETAAGCDGRQTGVRGRPMNVFVVVEGRPPRLAARRRPLRGHPPALPAALPCTVGWFTPDGRYVFFRLARRLDHQVRPVEPEGGGRGARRHQHAQRRREGDGKRVMAANYLPHTPGAVRRRTEPGPALRRATMDGQSARRPCTTPSRGAEFRGRARRTSRGLEISYDPKSRSTTASVHDYQDEGRFPLAGLSERAPHGAWTSRWTILLQPELRQVLAPRARTPTARPAARWSTWTCGARSPTPADRRHAAPGLGITFAERRPRCWPAPTCRTA